MSFNDLMASQLGLGNKKASVMSESPYFQTPDYVVTDVPVINAAFSGKINGGIVPGITIVAGESKSFKTLLSLYCMAAYLKKYPDAIAIVYDTEYGITVDYLKSVGIDPDRVLHVPIHHVEELKFDMVKRLEAMKRGQKIFYLVDSLGLLPSKKESDDAIEEKSVADMTRSKAIRSFFRMVTSRITENQIPLFVVNHFYSTMELYAKKIISGGQSVMLAANQAFIITKAQEKDGTDLVGWNFTINIEKSRFVKEKSKFGFTVLYDKGISKWSGLLDLALESGHVIKPKMGWYQIPGQEKNFRAKDTNNSAFWLPILQDKTFQEFVEAKFQVSHGDLMVDEDTEEVFDGLDEDENELET